MDPVALLDGTPAPDLATTGGYLHGITCFETMALVDGEVTFLEAHLDRLARGLETLELDPPGGLAGIVDHLQEALAAYQGADGVVRLSVHASGTMEGLGLEDRSAHVLVRVGPARHPELSKGVAVVTAARRAPDPETVPVSFKVPNLGRLLAYRQARERGAFEALMLDARGHVVTGTRSNVFAVVEGRLVTPPAPPALPGITRGRVLEAAGALGLEARVRPLHRDELPEADELFITFTGPGIVPVSHLDQGPVGEQAPGPVTGRLVDAL